MSDAEALQEDNAEVAAIAHVAGAPVTELPQDLYIPPDALRIFLEAFEGPLDLLLYLIRKQNLDILDIKISEITRQYMEYIDMMRELQFELAAEYLVMAAMLAEIKSRMLLPRPKDVEEEGEDPRAELIRRLQEYERFKKAAEDLNEMPREGRDIFNTNIEIPDLQIERPLPQVELRELLLAFKEILQRAKMYSHHHIKQEALSVRERMTTILSRLQESEFVEFTKCFTYTEGRVGVVVTFIAVLELLRQSLIEIVQTNTSSQIHIKAVGEYGTE